MSFVIDFNIFGLFDTKSSLFFNNIGDDTTLSTYSYNAFSIHYTLLSKFEAGTLILVRIII